MDNGIDNTELVFPVVSFKQLFTLKKTLDYFIDVVHQLNNKTKSIDSFSQEICLLTEEFFKNNQIDNLLKQIVDAHHEGGKNDKSGLVE